MATASAGFPVSHMDYTMRLFQKREKVAFFDTGKEKHYTPAATKLDVPQ